MKNASVKNTIRTGILASLLLFGVTIPAASQSERTLMALWGEIGLEPTDGSLLSRPVGLEVTGVTLPEALVLLANAADVSVAFSPNSLPEGLRVECHCQDASIAEALDQILSGTEFGYVELGDQIVIAKRAVRRVMESVRRPPAQLAALSMRPPPSLAVPMLQNGNGSAVARVQETGVIVGRVTEAGTGRPLSGVQMAIDGTGLGSLTNEEGRYVIPGVPAGTHRVRAVVLGFREERSSVTVQAGATVILDFTLQQAAILLDELVVTVTGEQRRRELGNVIGRIAATDSLMTASPISTLSELLTGRVGGVQVMAIDGMVGTSPTIRIRGINSKSTSNDPIFIVDGVRVNNQATVTSNTDARAGYGNWGGRLNDLSPSQIESIEIIKGPSAATLYGTDAANGVIVITTKRGRPGPA
ncbi:MAG: TonB-dependent receptor plug domain-containing protein, partial [Gemmatimonadota bacterium]